MAQMHPLVRTHPTTGQPVLYANGIYTRHIRGLPEADDPAALLRELCSLPGIPEFQARLSWQSAGDFVVWDNRQLQHYAVADYGGLADTTRLMEHSASLGTRPFFRRDDGTEVHSRFAERTAL